MTEIFLATVIVKGGRNDVFWNWITFTEEESELFCQTNEYGLQVLVPKGQLL